MFGDEDGSAEVAAELGIRHIPEVSRNEYGTPVVDSIFDTAQKIGKHDLFCYVNADIILMGDFITAVLQVYQQMPRFLIIGQRWDVEINESLDFSGGWERKLHSFVVSRGRLHPPTGIDYFVFPRGLFGEIPPFAVGRAAWDNWMLYRARSRKAALIDATQVVMAVHQNHDYAHVPGGAQEVWKGREAMRNLKLAGGYDKTFSLNDANWLLSPQGLIRAQTPEHRHRARETWLLLHCPHIYVIQKMFRKLSRQPRRLAGALMHPVRRLLK